LSLTRVAHISAFLIGRRFRFRPPLAGALRVGRWVVVLQTTAFSPARVVRVRTGEFHRAGHYEPPDWPVSATGARYRVAARFTFFAEEKVGLGRDRK